MKKLFKIFLVMQLINLYSETAKAQFVLIPDTNFVIWLNGNGYASCLNGNLMDTTCNTIINAINLNCSNNNLISNLTGIQYFDSLKYLASYNGALTYLPNLPIGLLELTVSGNLLTSLPPLPQTLQNLLCSSNLLTSLPILSPNLLMLTCSENQITNIPNLPSSLSNLACSENFLTSLPNFPSSIVAIRCNLNQLTALPSLPNSLLDLDCSNNQISVLPSLPLSLDRLFCYGNLLTTLPNLPANLYELQAHNNQLNSIPSLPDSMFQLFINNNSSISCLPKLKRIVNFNFSNTDVQCLPNYGTITSSNPAISTMPLCDMFNTNNCDAYWNISGKVYADPNNNCVSDNNEMHLSNIKLALDSTGIVIQQTYTGGEGFYSFKTDTGTYTYTVDTTDLPLIVTCPVSSFQTSIITAADSMDYDMDFGMQCKPGFDVGVTSVMRDSGIFRPANFAQIKIYAGDISNLYGLNCANGISGSIQIIFTGAVSFISPSVSALSPILSGDTLTYTISDFGSVNFDSDFSFILQTDTTAVMGSTICFDVTVSPQLQDINPLNNILNHCFTVINSFDPNTKEVYPEGIIDTSQQWLNYTINFQNTGNAEAQHIYILDSLDTNLDYASFELLAYSHMPLTQIIGNVVRFNFPNINLPDSTTDEPNSHGYVQYRTKVEAGLPIGTNISNTANIFFDFNSPILTNTVSNQIQITSGSNSLLINEKIKVYPNPVKHILNINFNSNGNEQMDIFLYDIFSRKILQQRFINTTTINMEFLTQGIYIYEVRSINGLLKTGKLVKD